MSGTDHHRAGEGLIDMPVKGTPEYGRYLNHCVVSLATCLREADYYIYMSGKWIQHSIQGDPLCVHLLDT